jgi:hypothetical protein
MNLLKETIRISLATKLVWLFGFLLVFPGILKYLSQFVAGNAILYWFYMAAIFPVLLAGLIAPGGLVYVVHQSVLKLSPTFSEACRQSGAKIFRIIGLMLLLSPLVVVLILIQAGLWLRDSPSPFLWLIVILFGSLMISLLEFGICAIMIGDAKVLAAAWKACLATSQSYFRVLAINGAYIIFRFVMIGLAGRLPTALVGGIIDLILYTLVSVALTLIYLQISERDSFRSAV